MKNKFSKLVMLGVGAVGIITATSGCATVSDWFQKPVDERAEQAYSQGEWSKAIQLYSTALREKGEQYKFYLNRGRSYKSVGRLSAALADLNKAKEIRPNDPRNQVVRARAEILYEQGDYEAAKEDARDVLQNNPDALQYQILKGKCLYKLEHYKEATRTFKEAYETVSPDSEQGLKLGSYLAWSFYKQKDYEKALQTYMERYFNVKQNSDDRSPSARDYYAAGFLYHVNMEDAKRNEMWNHISSATLRELKQQATLGIQ